MDIKTKFQLNQDVWMMKDNKPYSFKIFDIIAHVNMRDVGNYCSVIDTTIKYIGYSGHPEVYEDNCFASKEELIASL